MIIQKFAFTVTFCALMSSPLLTFAERKNVVEEDIPLEDIRLLTEVFHQVRVNYVNDISDKELINHAIDGMLNGLDPHSAYLNKDDYLNLQESTNGEFSGVGLEVTQEDGFVKIVAPIDDTPAYYAGIQAGDLIIKIDNQAVKGLSLDKSIDLMRGKRGSELTLTIIREGINKPVDFTITREIIRIKSVKSYMVENHFAYLRIAQFQNNTANDVRQHIEALLSDSNDKLHGLIIDLRNNPGGVLNAAVDIADLFINEGLLVYTEGRTAGNQEKFMATPNTVLPELPIVALINSGSASASEILAGALQDHKRAIIAGTTSFGKGSVQTILPLPKDNAIKLTTAKYYTPNGRSIQAEGIEPDIIVQRATLTLDEKTLEVTEANLSKHLKNDKYERKENKRSNNKTTHTGKVSKAMSDIHDYQIYEALNLLKAMYLTQAH